MLGTVVSAEVLGGDIDQNSVAEVDRVVEPVKAYRRAVPARVVSEHPLASDA